MTEIVQQLINALSLGSTYALLALGLAMVYSILNLVNFAHGELVTVAAYALLAGHSVGAPFPVQVVMALAAAAVTGVLTELVAFRPLRGAKFATQLFASFAVSVIIQNALRAFVSVRPQPLALPAVFNSTVTFAGLTISWLSIISTVTCLLSLGLLTLFLRRSTQGLGMMAAAQDFEIARLMGVPANRVISAAFAISGLLAGLAAIFIVARRGTVDPGMGLTPVIAALIGTVIGGLGSLSGAVVGGFVLGAIEVAFQALLPNSVLAYYYGFTMLVVIVILYFRPRGLLTRVVEER